MTSAVKRSKQWIDAQDQTERSTASAISVARVLSKIFLMDAAKSQRHAPDETSEHEFDCSECLAASISGGCARNEIASRKRIFDAPNYEQFTMLVDLAIQAFGADGGEQWLHTRQSTLGNKPPIDVIFDEFSPQLMDRLVSYLTRTIGMSDKKAA